MDNCIYGKHFAVGPQRVLQRWHFSSVTSEKTQAALLLIVDIRLDERVWNARLHGVFKVSPHEELCFYVLLQGQQGSLSAYCRYLRQETDTGLSDGQITTT